VHPLPNLLAWGPSLVQCRECCLLVLHTEVFCVSPRLEKVESDIKSLLTNKKIILPVDVSVQEEGGVTHKKPQCVEQGDNILDIGPETVPKLKDLVEGAQFILWNGPLGDYLIDGFDKGSIEFIRMLAESRAHTIVGGGDTVALISREGVLGKFDFVSTGGGAMLEFLSEQTLPGIEALKRGI